MPAISESRYMVHWHRPDRQKQCILCEETKPLSGFYAYGYTTKQGKQSTRYESRCIECSKARRKRQWLADPEKGKLSYKKWRQRNYCHVNEYAKRYRTSDRGREARARSQLLRWSRQRVGEAGGENRAEIRAIYAEARRIEKLVADCPVFSLPELGRKLHVDHVIPISKGGTHTIDNLQILPAGLNMRKGASCPQ
jgi:5-methylcytosine-specific restriction endonuclease McrA